MDKLSEVDPEHGFMLRSVDGVTCHQLLTYLRTVGDFALLCSNSPNGYYLDCKPTDTIKTVRPAIIACHLGHAWVGLPKSLGRKLQLKNAQDCKCDGCRASVLSGSELKIFKQELGKLVGTTMNLHYEQATLGWLTVRGCEEVFENETLTFDANYQPSHIVEDPFGRLELTTACVGDLKLAAHSD